jgi:hypothetical protein
MRYHDMVSKSSNWSPCPFTRVGIQLCQYGENGKVGVVAGAREKKRE